MRELTFGHGTKQWRGFVEHLDFLTTVGHGDRPGARERLGFGGNGPRAVITDHGVLKPHPATRELVLRQIHPGVELKQVLADTRWDLKVDEDLKRTPAPTGEELDARRELAAR